MLTAERLRELLDYEPETGTFTRRVDVRTARNVVVARAGDKAGCLDKRTGRPVFRVDNRLYQAHRLAWLYVHGCWPKGHIDHVNGVRTDNRIANLRDVDQKTNNQNMRRAHRDSKSGLLGVSWSASDKRWRAQICVNGQNRHIGNYRDPNEAHQAYLDAKRRLHEGCTI